MLEPLTVPFITTEGSGGSSSRDARCGVNEAGAMGVSLLKLDGTPLRCRRVFAVFICLSGRMVRPAPTHEDCDTYRRTTVEHETLFNTVP